MSKIARQIELSANLIEELPLSQLKAAALRGVRLVASLRLTCLLFALAMFVVFAGSLAQSRRDVWLVMEQYFRTWLAWIDVQDMFPPSMFGELGDRLAAKLGAFRFFPFPGGWSIGVLMLLNLVSAHALRFRVRATGLRLHVGIAITLLGMLLIVAVVVTGNDQTGVESGNTILTPTQIWWLLLSLLTVIGMIAAVVGLKAGTTMARVLLFGIALVSLGVLSYFLLGGEKARLNLSSMRILWQLLKGSACALVLLFGSNLLFEKRGGIAILHFGVALLMISELQVGLLAKENMLQLVEGETSNCVRDVRERELAIVVRKDPGKYKVVAIPEQALVDAANAGSETATLSPGQVIKLPSLPFDVAVRKYYRNSRLRALAPSDDVRLKEGLGAFAVPVPLDPVTGMQESSDSSSVYLDVLNRDSGEVLESLLVAQSLSDERKEPIAEIVDVEGNKFAFYLRFQRNYCRYSVKLIDVNRKVYLGTTMPRDFHSVVQIDDEESGKSQRFKLYMNNPLRYNGQTFYQTSYHDLGNGIEASSISVVNNTGWMLPYIACMIVAFGMFAQFGQSLSRFLNRTEREFATASVKQVVSVKRTEVSASDSRTILRYLPLVVLFLCVAWLGGKIRTPKETAHSMNLYGFAQLPIVWRGRTQPIDSVARIELLMNSHKSTFEGEMEPSELGMPIQRQQLKKAFSAAWPGASADWMKEFDGRYTDWIDRAVKESSDERELVEAVLRPHMVCRMPAVQWFLDVICRPHAADRHRVIRIDDDQVLSLLALQKRPGLTYSPAEVEQNFKSLRGDIESAMKKNQNNEENLLTQRERRCMTIFECMSRISTLQDVFNTSRFSREGKTNTAYQLVASWDVLERMKASSSILAIPTGNDDELHPWEALVASVPLMHLNQNLKEHNLRNIDEIVNFLLTELPGQVVSKDSLALSVRRNYQMLTDNLPAAEPPVPETIRSAARRTYANLTFADAGLKQVVGLIANASPEMSVQQIADSVTDEDVRVVGLATIAAELMSVIERIIEQDPNTKRLASLREGLKKIDIENSIEFQTVVITEGTRVVWSDLQERAGHLLPGGKYSEQFCSNTKSVENILNGWESQDVDQFNDAVRKYSTSLAAADVSYLDPALVRLEAWFNYYEPFYKATCIYLIVAVLSCLSWLFLERPLWKTSILLMGLAFLIHTAALFVRMWISGRPPVTNLYSSAIFIGWAVVVASFVLEGNLRNGIGNVLGAAVGASTLVIAHYLARDEGDTMGVMQAVLDTTFWLATHVVCITLGYAATFLAGILGFFYCVQACIGRPLSRSTALPLGFAPYLASFGKLVYGTLCFAVFLSLVGTVLGGLWADDSWGRFWGWDPKENGAMMIVLWNALILHARWGKMIRDYGTAVLAMVGNIVTSWSWFGVNELGAGLHEYGFTEGRLFALVIFVAVQSLIVIAFVAVARHRSASLHAA